MFRLIQSAEILSRFQTHAEIFVELEEGVDLLLEFGLGIEQLDLHHVLQSLDFPPQLLDLLQCTASFAVTIN